MCLLAACCVVPAVGQDWKEALKSAASNVVDKATGGKATETLMIGDWQYEAPGVKLESDNALADVGASAVTGKMEEQLEKLLLRKRFGDSGRRGGLRRSTARQRLDGALEHVLPRLRRNGRREGGGEGRDQKQASHRHCFVNSNPR